MTENIKSNIRWKNSIHNKYHIGLRTCADYVISQQAISEVSELVVDAKNSYYDKLANKLTDASTGSKI